MDEAGAYYTEWSKSEKERQILYINAYIYMEFRKMVLMVLHAGHQRGHSYKEQTFGLSGRRRGWDDLEKPLPSVKYTTSASSMHEVGHPKPVLWDNPEGWGGEGGGGGFMMGGRMYLWPIHVDVWKEPSQYCNCPPMKTIN